MLFVLALIFFKAASAEVVEPAQGQPLSTIQFYNTRYYYPFHPPYYRIGGSILGNFYASKYYPYVYHQGSYSNYDDTNTARNIFQHPVFIVTKVDGPQSAQLAFADKGLQSVFTDPNLAYIKTYVQTPQPKVAVILHADKYFNARLYNTIIDRVTPPRDYKVADQAWLVSYFDKIPVVAFFDQADFELHNFSDIYDFGKFAVYPLFFEQVVDTQTPVPRP